MKLELKNIKHSASLSEETYAYTAVLYRDGKAVARISNHGTGGADMQHPIAPATHADIREIDAWCKTNLPPFPSGIEGTAPLEQDLEMWCSEQVTKHLLAGDLTRALKGKVIFVRDEKLYQISRKGQRTLTPVQVASLATDVLSKGPATILNTLPFDEALTLYRKHG